MQEFSINPHYYSLNENGYSITAGPDVLIKTNGLQRCFVRTFSISFYCRHQTNEITDSKIQQLYRTIISGNAHELLQANPNQCVHNSVTGLCGNVREMMTECRCETLNRVTFPERRKSYENKVIHTLHEIIHSQGNNFFTINLAIFASGGLHGEEVLLLRLIEELRTKHAGIISLFLIDTDYQENIKESGKTCFVQPGKSFSWDLLVGNRQDLKQFLFEVTNCLPSNIHLKGTVFGSLADYVSRANNDPNFCNDLLIGSDIGDNVQRMAQIQQTTNRSGYEAIILLKDFKETAQLCSLNASSVLKCDRL